MKLKVKDMDISTGGICIVLLYHKTARLLDLRAGDRLLIKKGKRSIVAILDIAETKKAINENQIGLFEEVLSVLRVKNGDIVEFKLEKKPESIHFIKEKLERKRLDYERMKKIIEDINSSNLTDIEMTYFVSGCYTNKLTLKETVALTRSMIDVGDRLKIKGLVLDKHCIGGVAGNRTTMLIVPIITSTGLKMPKTSSRAISSAAGTADSMEVIAKVDIDINRMKDVIKQTNGCIVWSGSMNLAAADDKLINIRHPLSLDPLGMMLASVMAKKGAVSAKKVLVDIPYGKGAKVEDKRNAIFLRRKFSVVGKELKIQTHVIVTDGSQPIGNGIGPVLEVRDIMRVLRNSRRMPIDLYKKVIMMSAILLKIGKKAKSISEGKKLAKKILDKGKAYDQMMKIIKAQGGSTNEHTLKKKLRLAKFRYDVIANKSGEIIHINNRSINSIARIAGAPEDKAAGIYLYKHKGSKVKKGDVLYTLYAQSKIKLKYAKEYLDRINGVVIK